MNDRPENGPRVIGMSHDIADENIRRLRQRLIDEPDKPEPIRSMWRERIDKWLEYRLGPNEERRL